MADNKDQETLGLRLLSLRKLYPEKKLSEVADILEKEKNTTGIPELQPPESEHITMWGYPNGGKK